MLFNDIYGISREVPLPWWIERNPLLDWLVYNPIFQLHMKKKYKPPVVNGLKGFIAGILYFIAIFWVFRMKNDDPEVGSRYFLALFLLPVLVLAVAGFVRTMLLCLIAAPRDMRREIESYRMHSVLSTPISDSDIFFSNAYQVLLRSMAANIGTLVFLIILVVPSMIVVTVNGWSLLEFFSIELGVSGTIPIRMVLLFFGCTLYIYITCLAGTMYAIHFPAFSATVATVSHIALALFFTLLVTVVAGSAILPNANHLLFTWDTVWVEGFNAILLLLITWLTGRLGVMTFARYRRPGFFEPEFASASGL